jgi:hypothetical protein
MGRNSDLSWFASELRAKFGTRMFTTIEVQIKFYLAPHMTCGRMQTLLEKGYVVLVQSGEPKKFHIWRMKTWSLKLSIP